MRTVGSRVAKPCTTAATDDDWEAASTTSTMGASSGRAMSAVDEGVPSAAPSNSPMTPSTTSRSAPAAARAARGRMASRPHSQASRLRGGRPQARAW